MEPVAPALSCCTEGVPPGGRESIRWTLKPMLIPFNFRDDTKSKFEDIYQNLQIEVLDMDRTNPATGGGVGGSVSGHHEMCLLRAGGAGGGCGKYLRGNAPPSRHR